MDTKGALEFEINRETIVGEMVMWPDSSAPSGWLLCNGDAVSRTTYAALWALIGTTFGSGDGSTTFNVPDFRDRCPQGASATDAIGAQVGVKLQTSIPSHRHEMLAGSFEGGIADRTTRGDETGPGTGYTQYTGVSGGVDQRGPRFAINFIIRWQPS